MKVDELFVGAPVSYNGKCHKVIFVNNQEEVGLFDSNDEEHAISTYAHKVAPLEVGKDILKEYGYTQNKFNPNLYEENSFQYDLERKEVECKAMNGMRIPCKHAHTLHLLMRVLKKNAFPLLFELKYII